MLSWISDKIFGIISWIPNWLYADDTPRYLIIRSLLGLLAIVLVIFAIAIWRGRGARSHQPQNSSKGTSTE